MGTSATLLHKLDHRRGRNCKYLQLAMENKWASPFGTYPFKLDHRLGCRRQYSRQRTGNTLQLRHDGGFFFNCPATGTAMYNPCSIAHRPSTIVTPECHAKHITYVKGHSGLCGSLILSLRYSDAQVPLVWTRAGCSLLE